MIDLFGGPPAVPPCMFSPCRRYRYTLYRRWGPGDCWTMFVALNPSTADDERDDPTVRRCVGFARAWGYDGLIMTNLFAFRATDPLTMKAMRDPVGPDNDTWLVRCAGEAALVVAAWGTHGGHMDRDAAVARLLPDLRCLALTGAGRPRHPLYLRGDLRPVPYRFDGAGRGTLGGAGDAR